MIEPTGAPEASRQHSYPKMELHVLLAGTVRAGTLLQIGGRNGIALPADWEAGLAGLYEFRDFAHFVEIWLLTTGALRTEQDFRQVVVDYAGEAAAHGAVYLEGIFSPAEPVGRGVAWEEVFTGYCDGAQQAREQHGVEGAPTPDIPRGVPPAGPRRRRGALLGVHRRPGDVRHRPEHRVPGRVAAGGPAGNDLPGGPARRALRRGDARRAAPGGRGLRLGGDRSRGPGHVSGSGPDGTDPSGTVPAAVPFRPGVPGWVSVLGRLRDGLRQEGLASHLASLPQLAGRSARVLDVGCGQGTPALRAARAGHEVTGIDSSPELLARFEQALAAEPAGVSGRLRLIRGAAGRAP